MLGWSVSDAVSLAKVTLNRCARQISVWEQRTGSFVLITPSKEILGAICQKSVSKSNHFICVCQTVVCGSFDTPVTD